MSAQEKLPLEEFIDVIDDMVSPENMTPTEHIEFLQDAIGELECRLTAALEDDAK